MEPRVDSASSSEQDPANATTVAAADLTATTIVDVVTTEPVISPEAKKYGFIEKLRLLRSRRLVLLVDLDQTLIHTTNEDIPPTMKNVMHFQLDGPTWYHMRMRPHTLEFLHSVSQKFELHICSFGARMYAHTVARMMDPDGALFGLRILSRDECFDPFLKTANLKALFPCGDHLVCIIDDREDVWNFASNVVHVKPYRFFKHTGDINAPPGFTKADRNEENNVEANDKSTPERNKKEVGDVSEPALRPSSSAVISKSPTKEATSAEIVDDDNYLKSLEKILFRIHDAFYQMYDQMPDEERPPCLHSIIPYVKLKVLKGVNLVFSGIIPTHVKPETTQIFKVAEAFGAQIQNQIVSTSDSKDPSKWTTHLVACKWGTEKVLQAYDLDHVHIVIPEWLWSCAERWTKVDPEPFCLTPPNSRSKLVKRSPVDRSSCIVEKLANDKMDFSPSAVHNGRRRVADADLEETEDVTYSAENSSLAYNLEPARKRPAINSSVQAEVPRSSNRFEQVSVNDSDISSSSAESEDDISTDEIVDDLERCIAE
ncbi:unnamed protein product [Soboliphyme baturini]|uniref:RNA polymerase II subunit A C-terminal domain phosphatase n=1 Tax=Soboliphyme baturini TaxID=241478 RepID=A0A183IQU2_9BILA|nr:unnamed protein product [Soboliphyme baturini]